MTKTKSHVLGIIKNFREMSSPIAYLMLREIAGNKISKHPVPKQASLKKKCAQPRVEDLSAVVAARSRKQAL